MSSGPFHFESLGWMEPPGFAGREVRVFVPSRFEPRVPTPALFLFDGQNVFEGPPGQEQGWFVHEAIEGMDPRWNVAPLVVAIPSGPSWDEREAELTPWPTEGRGGRADAFLDWVVHAVVPRTRERFLLPEGALGAVVGGASWGGLLALHAHFAYPHLFGGALALSPSCWVGNFAIFESLRHRERPPFSRIYIDCGGREAEGRMLPPAEALAGELRVRGYSRSQLWWRPDPDADHNERAWRRRLPRALRFMFRRGPRPGRP
jgi:predicted alpha/beta superfamily hydrolase